ncbi:hypothetical protein GYMLUDRAFT_48765 [Collybiopsis luxurians FD-317 M1]|uniref:Heterokaryon incompatibility domain-containing protein n=1 Tax=Collybiopsis luxurians FD-317 M1 TaxID=944289 RepID=A0A0D0BXA3_9AGAR|nr:hypothetical protein GYMLUDRAFT_48765 [Collybiopsis luxurians FD-317 M1]
MSFYPFPGGKLPYGWEDVEKSWPRRLLHIPSMTSIERSGLNVYGTAQEPKYSILTYTWGRWQVKEPGPLSVALPVKGTTWKIPVIKEEHFTVDAFQRIVNRMGEDGIEWAWIDVACIDQENTTVKMDEIGKQASIFLTANKVFVWLSHLSTNRLKAAVDEIDNYGPQLYFVDTPSEKTSLHEIVERLHTSYGVIFDDPWFSSLWTLQEVILRSDACVLSREGDLILQEPKGHLFLTMFINTCQNNYREIEKYAIKLEEKRARRYIPLEESEQRTLSLIQEILHMILSAGFYFLFTDNPNVQYGIARYRKTSHEEDRVYAIMQAFGLRVGKSIRPDDEPPLDQLFDEFALAINSKSPILGQAFVHTTLPDPNKSWRITQSSRVPEELMSYKEPNAQSSIAASPSSIAIMASGKHCLFEDLLQLAESVDQDPLIPQINLSLILDDYIRDSYDNKVTLSQFSSPESMLKRYSPILREEHGENNLRVFLLGDIRGIWNLHHKKFGRRYVGLLLQRQEKLGTGLDADPLNYVTFKRLGVCIWEPRSAELQKKVDEIEWRNVELELC